MPRMTCSLQKCNQPAHNTIKMRCKEHCPNFACYDAGCKTRPNYNEPGQIKGKYCDKHKKQGMIRVVGQKPDSLPSKIPEAAPCERFPLLDDNVRLVVTKHIRDEFWLGKYGSVDLVINVEIGYINASYFCKIGSAESERDYYDYSCRKAAKSIFHALSHHLDIPIASLTIARGGKGSDMVRGTYIHCALIPSVAAWVSPSLATRDHPLFRMWIKQGDNRARYAAAIASTRPCRLLSEALVQKTLASLIGADREVTCTSGRIDLLTPTMLIEVKRANAWIKALGQVLAYGCDYPDHKKVIYIYDLDGSELSGNIVACCRQYNVAVVSDQEGLLDLAQKCGPKKRRERQR